ncbi:hypothetical protein N9B72_01040, partial [Bacteriovoracaceae bacterium]|nr:hypothetical protein [Bacteriovoracaceae bacterium]
MKKLLLLLTLSSLIFSCAKQKKVPAKFKVMIGGLSAGITALNDKGEGGLALWGRNKTTGLKFGHVFHAPYPADIGFDLELGDWEFYGTLWEGDNDGTLNEVVDRLTGTTRCSFVNNFTVQTGAQINLVFNQATCANGKFAPATHMIVNAFMPTKMISCDHLH